jgi:hypothetical protein
MTLAAARRRACARKFDSAITMPRPSRVIAAVDSASEGIIAAAGPGHGCAR